MLILTHLQRGANPCALSQESLTSLVKHAQRAQNQLILCLLSAHPDFTHVHQELMPKKPIVTVTPKPTITPLSNINRPNEFGETDLYRACASLSSKEVIHYLLAHGAAVDLPESHCLHYVCSRGEGVGAEILKIFLGQPNAPINALDESDRTPLHWAAYYGNSTAIEMLLAHPDIKINEINAFGKTPLDEAEDFEQEYALVATYRKAIAHLKSAGCKTAKELEGLASERKTP
jgi:ankyrin repeat protein